MNDQPLVEFYSKEDCHLCDVAKDVLFKVRRKHPFRLVEVHIQPGTEEYEKFKEKIPVIMVNKQFVFHYRVNEKELLKILKSTS